MRTLSLVERALAGFDFDKAYNLYSAGELNRLLASPNKASWPEVSLHLVSVERFKGKAQQLLLDVSRALDVRFVLKGRSGGSALKSGVLYAIGYYHADENVKVLELLYVPLSSEVRSNDEVAP